MRASGRSNFVNETEHFERERFGWTCRRCRDAQRSGAQADKRVDENGRDSRQEGRARFFHEGESEERDGSRLSARALARWRETDGVRVLFCPSCGAEDAIKEDCETAG